MNIISWNMAHWHEPWRCLLDMDIDLALLQEAGRPPPDVAERIQADPAVEIDPAPWETLIVEGRPPYRTAIVKLSNRIAIDWIEAKSLETAKARELVVSWPSTLTAAFVTPPSGDLLIAVSTGRWPCDRAGHREGPAARVRGCRRAGRDPPQHGSEVARSRPALDHGDLRRRRRGRGAGNRRAHVVGRCRSNVT